MFGTKRGKQHIKDYRLQTHKGGSRLLVLSLTMCVSCVFECVVKTVMMMMMMIYTHHVTIHAYNVPLRFSARRSLLGQQHNSPKRCTAPRNR